MNCAGQSKKMILRHVWTLFLFGGGFIFLVWLPHAAIIENRLAFWSVVVVGLCVSFICAASEIAFACACGENESSETYKTNQSKLLEFQTTFYDLAKDQTVRDHAKEEARKVQRLIKVGEDYTSVHNPTLVVANNVANILVAVVSTSAIYDTPVAQSVGSPCSWMTSTSLANHPLLASAVTRWLPSLRCIGCLGHSLIPFPVSSVVFQSAFALTLILLIGEMLPKQLAALRPAETTRGLFPIYRIVGVLFSLGTGRSFGALGRQLERCLEAISPSRTN